MQPINLVWLQGQGCTGDTVALISAREPSLVDALTGILPEVSEINLVYHPTVMAPRGDGALKVLDDAKVCETSIVIEECRLHRQKYLFVE